jgi:hypothetical protein
MKHILFFCCLLIISINLHGQTFNNSTTLNEWNVSNTSSSPGERIVAIITQDTNSPFRGAEITGQIIDGNGNWGYSTPTVANFRAVVAFYPGGAYGITQDIQTSNLTLELKSLNSTQIAVVANCNLANTQMRILFRFTNGIGTSLTMGDPTTVNSSGTMLISQPTYQSNFSGSIGINTLNTHGFNLAVNGSAIATSMTVQLYGSWPDYVFKPKYALKSLFDLKTYIDQNHHLPEIPSAEQVEKDGLNLGEMNKLLVKKVEELTLYMIELQNQLKAEQKQIDQLKSKR